MQVRDYSIPQGPRPSFVRASLEPPSGQRRSISSRRSMCFQVQTDLYLGLDTNPQHKLASCSDNYELEDRSMPSVSSF